MFRFYWTLLCRVPRLLLDATGRTKSIVAILAFILAISNQEWANRISGHLSGISPWWSAVPVVLIILYGMMRAIYEIDKENRLALQTAEVRIAKLEKQLNKQEVLQQLEHNLGFLLESGQSLLQGASAVDCVQGRPLLMDDNEEYEGKVSAWIEEVKQYLSPSEKALFLNNTGLIAPNYYDQSLHRIKIILAYRLQRLREHLERLSQLDREE